MIQKKKKGTSRELEIGAIKMTTEMKHSKHSVVKLDNES